MLCIISRHPICFTSQLRALSVYKVIKGLVWKLFCLQLARLASCLWCSAADHIRNETPWNCIGATLPKGLFLNLRQSYQKRSWLRQFTSFVFFWNNYSTVAGQIFRDVDVRKEGIWKLEREKSPLWNFQYWMCHSNNAARCVTKMPYQCPTGKYAIAYCGWKHSLTVRADVKRLFSQVPLKRANFSPESVGRFYWCKGLEVQGRQWVEMAAEMNCCSRNSSKITLKEITNGFWTACWQRDRRKCIVGSAWMQKDGNIVIQCCYAALSPQSETQEC